MAKLLQVFYRKMTKNRKLYFTGKTGIFKTAKREFTGKMQSQMENFSCHDGGKAPPENISMMLPREAIFVAPRENFCKLTRTQLSAANLLLFYLFTTVKNDMASSLSQTLSLKGPVGFDVSFFQLSLSKSDDIYIY